MAKKSPPGRDKRRKAGASSQWKGIVVLCAFLVALVLVGVFAPRLIEKWGEEAPVSSSAPVPADLPGVDMPGIVWPDFSVPDVSLPAPAGPDFSFTEEETRQLDEMLDAWAEETTYITKTEDEEGEPLDEPVTEAAGGHSVAVWYMDIESGLQYSYNAGQQMFYASMLKGPYAAWLYILAAQGECDLDEMVEVTEADIGKYVDNTGVLKTMPLPAQLSVEDLIGMMLRHSDTVALRKLLAKYPAAGFVQWAEELGLRDAKALHTVIYGEVDAADMGILALATYEVMVNGGEYGERLRAHMESAGNKMIVSDHVVAHKYGWDEKAYHDMAVVFAPHPYVMVIMTDKWGGSWAEMAMFGNVSRAVEGMVAEKWTAYENEAV